MIFGNADNHKTMMVGGTSYIQTMKQLETRLITVVSPSCQARLRERPVGLGDGRRFPAFQNNIRAVDNLGVFNRPFPRKYLRY